MSRLGPGMASNCAHCGGPLRNGKGQWSARMPIGLAAWLCLPCDYLYSSKRVKGGDPLDGFEIPDSFKPEWNR